MTIPAGPPGWYPDPGGSGRPRYWNGTAWGEVWPTTPVYKKPWFILVAVVVAMTTFGVILNAVKDGNNQKRREATSTLSTGYATYPVPTTATPSPTPLATTPRVVPASCVEAPSVVVDQINAAFTNGEHLEDVQAVNGPKAAKYVGGNIVDAAGKRISSNDTWVLLDGEVYAITSDARRHTLLKDGRDLQAIYYDWPQYNDQVGKCVGAATKPGG